ncbi:uncharacterized protein LOC142573018 isoform X1 [Dermacentor variabilis]|uniref:uncharacterized protein LOC142573018 isoform X1 n=1 Tax=Dermacentor variabilis TaxID=34621 RepID=UPI003F5C5AA6
MSHLLNRRFRAHRRTHSTPPGGAATEKSPRNALPASRAALTDVPEHEELRSGGRRQSSCGLASAASTASGPAQEAKVSLNKYVTLNASGGVLPKNRDWLRLQHTIRSLFKTKDFRLEPGEMAILHEKIRTLGSSKAEPFLFDSFKGKGSTTVRQAFLVVFRDAVVTKLELEDLINENTRHLVPDGIRHMLRILYNVSDSYPPTKTKLKLEVLLARLLDQFLGFHGFYEGKPEPTVKSAEPEVAARRKSADGVPLPRKLSRPMSSQPRQIETLHELFLTALRKQPDF